MRSRHFLPHFIVMAALAPMVLAGCLNQPAISETPPPASSFDPALVAAGARLAAIGNCIDCHTADGAPPYAGGRPLKTSFGIVYGTNITPDPETGIGGWTPAAFTRAMREGIDRDGRHLYPAFPYDHFTKLTDDDVKALYAYIMTRDPVRAVTPPNRLSFPFNIRPLIGIWKRMYFEPGGFVPDSSSSPELNRGAYLVQGLAHCGACHTPRDGLGGEKRGEFLGGGQAEGWDAPALNARAPAPEPWTVDALSLYLRQGHTERHGMAAGPMAPVVHNLSNVPEQDVRAMAAYVVAQMGSSDRRARSAPAAAPAGPGDPAVRAGETIFAGACASCHGPGGVRGSPEEALPLQASTSVYLPMPRNFLQIVLHGISPRDGEPGRWMPEFSGGLTDAQVAALAAYARSLGGAPPWRDVENEGRKIRRENSSSER